jgi:signal transduction histidine kinase
MNLMASVALAGLLIALVGMIVGVLRARRHPPGSTAGADDAGAGSGIGGIRESDLRRLLGLLMHELRTPLGAIVGYGELLSDGMLGPLPERALEAVRRIGMSGTQLRHLIDGLSDLFIADAEGSLDLQQVDCDRAAAEATAHAHSLASGRSVELEAPPCGPLPTLLTDPARLAAALDLAIGAAIRASPGLALRLSFSGEGGRLAARVEGSALDPDRDAPVLSSPLSSASGPGLRLAMASQMLSRIGGQLRLEHGSPATLALEVPSLPPTAAAPR